MLDLQKREGARLFLAKRSLCLYKPTFVWWKQFQVHQLCCLHEAVVLGWCKWDETTLYILIGRILWLLSIQMDFFICVLVYRNSCIMSIWVYRYRKTVDSWCIKIKGRLTIFVHYEWICMFLPPAITHMFSSWSEKVQTLKHRNSFLKMNLKLFKPASCLEVRVNVSHSQYWLLEMILSAHWSVTTFVWLSHWGILFSFKNFIRKGLKWLCSSGLRVDHPEHLRSSVGSWSVAYTLESWIRESKIEKEETIFKNTKQKRGSIRKSNMIVCYHMSKMPASNHFHLLSSVCIIRSARSLALQA